jgi:hypothetical protein
MMASLFRSAIWRSREKRSRNKCERMKARPRNMRPFTPRIGCSLPTSSPGQTLHRCVGKTSTVCAARPIRDIPRLRRQVGLPIFLLLRNAVQLLGQPAREHGVGRSGHAGLPVSATDSADQPASICRADGVHELHATDSGLHDDILRAWPWAVWPTGPCAAIRDRARDLGGAISLIADLAAVFLVRAA